MKCADCPFSMLCMSGRLDRAFMFVAICPMCERLYLLIDPTEEEKRQEAKRQAREDERQAAAKEHGIDLSYEQTLDDQDRFRQEYLGVWVPPPRTTSVTFHCEKRPVTRGDRQRWKRMRQQSNGLYRHGTGWVEKDDIGGTRGPLNFRPCPECVRWPEPHITQDLDEQARYEEEKARAQPAFRLKNRR